MHHNTHKLQHVGRLLIGLMFLVMGVMKLMNFEMMTGYAESLGVPAPALMMGIVMILELAGGLMLILGKKVVEAAKMLAVLMVVIILVAHRDLAVQANVTAVLKNLAIIGGLLLVASAPADDKCSCMKK